MGLKIFESWERGGAECRSAPSPVSVGGFPKKFVCVSEEVQEKKENTGVSHRCTMRLEEGYSDRFPQFCLQFGQLFTTERVKHSVVERAEEQTTMLELVCI